jgi:peroxiredoxin Q/BCP
MEKLQIYLQKFPQTIVYFYPKDNTPWCTIEAHDFTTYKNIFNKNWIGIVGVSKDSASSHAHFIEKECLAIDLLSDEDLALHKEFWVWWEKNMYGKIVHGAIRSTFLIDQKWTIVKERRNVKAAGHVEKLISELHLS